MPWKLQPSATGNPGNQRDASIGGTRRLRATLTTGPPCLPDSKSLFLAPWKATLGPKKLRVSTTAPFDELAGETAACFRAQCGFSQKTSFSPQFPLRRRSNLLSAACPGRAPALRSQGLGCSLQKFRPHHHNPPGQSSPSWPH